MAPESSVKPRENDRVAGSVAQRADSDLALALAEGVAYAEAGKRCGVSERTVQRRMREPEFRALVAETERARWAIALRKLSAKSGDAADVLVDLLDEAAAAKPGASIRLRSAMAILDLRHSIGETAEMSNRLDEVEAAIRDALADRYRNGDHQ